MITLKVTGLNDYKAGDRWSKQVTLTEDPPPPAPRNSDEPARAPLSFSFTVGDDALAAEFTRDAEFTLAPKTATNKSK